MGMPQKKHFDWVDYDKVLNIGVPCFRETEEKKHCDGRNMSYTAVVTKQLKPEGIGFFKVS